LTFEEATTYLFSAFPSFEKSGKVGINEGLSITKKLLQALGNPQDQLRCIHIAGTNGKGSSSHFLASICQEAGYKTGLFTSPHLKSFTERIRVNGIEIPKQLVIDFIVNHRSLLDELKPSFFEITTALAFLYFKEEEVDISIIETGLGGRLDSTNVLSDPLVTLITNVGWDHMNMLGNDIETIAFEKAGIIKSSIPVVLSEENPDYLAVMVGIAKERQAPLSIASQRWDIDFKGTKDSLSSFQARNKATQETKQYESQLLGLYQAKNIAGVLETCDVLASQGYRVKNFIAQGLRRVVDNTGMKGRWQILSHKPYVVCDAVHNVSGWEQILAHIKTMSIPCGVMVLGFSSDKNPEQFIDSIPVQTKLIFCSFNNTRSVNPETLQRYALEKGFEASYSHDVNAAIEQAKAVLPAGSFIFVGGSIYLLSELNTL